jgi:2,3-bisphosphoglycerate-dependent phosphoglycerate mutase
MKTPGRAPARDPIVEAGSYRLVLMRHGQSEWNARNLFAGWADPDLTPAGEEQAVRAGQMLADQGLLPDVTHTSLQRRAIRSAELALAACGRDWVPLRPSWRLNGRHYGALQGQDKHEVCRKYGEQRVMSWRRSYDAAPPPLAVGSSPPGAAHYPQVRPEDEPRSESLRDVTERLLPYWHDAVVPDLRTGACVLIVSHGNTLRALIKYLDGIDDNEIAGLNIPNAMPLLYCLGPDMRPLVRGSSYLAG